MKSVEQYPEYQVESGNIQFLTRKEHLEAHDGSWQNPTNWFFDPISKEKIDFGDGPFIPCKTFDLRNPVPLDFLRSGVVGEQHQKVCRSGKANGSEPHQASCARMDIVSRRRYGFDDATQIYEADEADAAQTAPTAAETAIML